MFLAEYIIRNVFNYFTFKQNNGVSGEENLLDRIERMGETNPLWVDVTW